ncbi:MAG: hypothetical protein ACR2PI_14865 [Hyphomicrobiaceae bacterium]
MIKANFFDDCSENQFHLLSGVLSGAEIDTLIEVCRDNLERPDAVPCFALLDKQGHPILEKIHAALECCVAERLHYLNDFYIYTKGDVRTDWHMDTELFTFQNSCNAWILLSPDEVASPLAIMRGPNEPNQPYYHSAEAKGDTVTFTNYKTGARQTVAAADIEANKIAAPNVRRGDILVFNPKRFHKTNIESPKHVLALKYVSRGTAGYKSPEQVPGLLWPETRLLNRLLTNDAPWRDVLAGIGEALATEKGRASLSAGSFPERTRLYRDALNGLATKSQAGVN